MRVRAPSTGACPTDLLFLASPSSARQKGTPYLELGLDNPALDDAALLSAMLAHPILINRRFVRTPLGTRLCRPSEQVRELLPPATRAFVKEDGEPVLDETGQRIGA